MISIEDMGILADDLTGACDVAASFTSLGRPVGVYVRGPTLNPGGSSPVVINTQSRILSFDACREVNYTCAAPLKNQRILLNKVDSSLRGRVTAEIRGIADAVLPNRIIVVPSIPAIGRTVRNGVLYDNGTPAHNSALGLDPLTPLPDSSVSNLLQGLSDLEIEIADAESNDEIEVIIERTIRSGKILYVGSLGIAEALARRMGRNGELHTASFKKDSFCNGVPKILIVSGSSYEATRRQLEKARDFFDTDLLELSDTTDPFDLKSIPRNSSLRMLSLRTMPYTKRRTSKAFANIHRFIKLIIERYRPDGLGVIGGETAYHIFTSLKVSHVQIFGRLTEVMPYGKFTDGRLAGKRFITKGGSVGNEDSLIEMINFLQGRHFEI